MMPRQASSDLVKLEAKVGFIQICTSTIDLVRSVYTSGPNLNTECSLNMRRVC